MLSGERAFAGDTAAQVLSAVLRDDPNPLPQPSSIERTARRCLSKKPVDRFQTMQEVTASLEEEITTVVDLQPSIAVLPFANMSGDQDQEYFSDGLAEEIISALTHIPGLKVTARTSAFAFRGKEQDITKIAEALRVSTVLEGSVRRAGSRIRVTAQLINARDGYHLWSERYDRELADVFAIQDEIAHAIAAALQLKLVGRLPDQQHVPALAAYDALLRGRHHLFKLSPETWPRAKECFEQAIALDPAYAEAHAYLGLGYFFMGMNGILPLRDVAGFVRAEAQQALDLKAQAEKARTNADGGQVDQAYQLLDAQVGAASFNAEIARLQLESLKSGNRGGLNAAYARIVQAQRELDRVKAGPTQAQIDQANIAVQQAQLQVNQAAKALADMSLTAASDGIVSAVNVQVGSVVSPTLPAVQITDISPLHVVVQVDEVDIHKIREGSPTKVKVDALPGVELPATIKTIALVGTNDNGIINYDVHVRLDANDPRVRAGMTAEASVVVEQKSNVLSVPNEYIRLDRQRDKAYVNVVDKNGHLEETEVTLGLQGDDTSEVIGGIREGDILAISLGGDRLAIFGG
jgi:RND family efflux transporter MFP subunit